MTGEGEGNEGRKVSSSPLSLPLQPFFCFRSNFRAITRLETLATQAKKVTGTFEIRAAGPCIFRAVLKRGTNPFGIYYLANETKLCVQSKIKVKHNLRSHVDYFINYRKIALAYNNLLQTVLTIKSIFAKE